MPKCGSDVISKWSKWSSTQRPHRSNEAQHGPLGAVWCLSFFHKNCYFWLDSCCTDFKVYPWNLWQFFCIWRLAFLHERHFIMEACSRRTSCTRILRTRITKALPQQPLTPKAFQPEEFRTKCPVHNWFTQGGVHDLDHTPICWAEWAVTFFPLADCPYR